MNTWCNTEKPPLNQPIFITDGETVYFGHYEISPISKSIFFMGADLENGDIFTIAPDGLRSITGWQPAPDTWKPEKTADEMFRELGYEKAEENKDYIAYLKKDNWRTEIRFYYRMTKRVKKSLYSHWGTFIGPEYLFFNEMLACAQLIKEMEETK